MYKRQVQELIDLQMDAAVPDSAIQEKQAELNRLYDSFSAKYGLINDRANRLAYADDSSYYPVSYTHLDAVTVSLSIDSIRQLYSGDAADFVEDKILPNGEKNQINKKSLRYRFTAGTIGVSVWQQE